TLESRGLPRAARRAATESGGSNLHPQLALGNRNEPAARGDSFRSAVATEPFPARAIVSADIATRALVAPDDLRHAGDRVHHAFWRLGCDDGTGLRQHWPPLPFLLATARLARRRPHRQRHVVERAFRQPATDHRAAVGFLARACSSGQQLRW